MHLAEKQLVFSTPFLFDAS